jgi:serine/threonine-protein kinase
MTVGTNDITVDPRATPQPRGHRFAPGAIVGGRYRLVALLGRGGMGEVYRADDLTLDQPVALKFLPVTESAGGADDAERLAQLHNELRVARQVSHKNVCRVYDLGDADGRRFITMEYVDGEDLGSLLRRIGHIPHDKAIQIARQLCAGVAAAHERGVLHRDLKPANVMIDGEGNVRITDFGIATPIRDTHAGLAGTPQYLAPELLHGQPASVKSDIYALGLVLFEIFTGRRAYDARTIADAKQVHETSTITLPSALVRDLDPAVERVILRCLERDPERRPASVLTVAAALPGGDPLAAALAAGETPSPDLLVAAGESEAWAVAPALTAALTFVVALFLFAFIASRASLTGLVPMERSRDVLEDRAQQVIKALGYSPEAADTAVGLVPAQDYLRWAAQNSGPGWWQSLDSDTPAGVWFWYRSSPREFLPVVQGGSVTPVDPPMNVSGMHQVFLDTRGRLVEFHSVPPQVEPDEARPEAPAWGTLFDLAGLDIRTFKSVPPLWTPRDFADMRVAWEGPLTGRPDITVRVEGAAFRGLPVSFAVVGPWTRPTRMQPIPRTTSQRVGIALNIGFGFLVILGGALLARHNVRANRADLRGAARLGIAVTLALEISGFLSAHQASTALLSSLGQATRFGVIVWLLYLAIEPYARRFWPDGLLGWTRLLSGRVLDPRIGRDVLIGLGIAAAGLSVSLIPLVPLLLGKPEGVPPFGTALTAALGPTHFLARCVAVLYSAVETALEAAMIFAVMRLALKRTWLTLLAGGLVLMLVTSGVSVVSGNWFNALAGACFVAVMTFTVNRYGLLALTVMLFATNLLRVVPLTLNPAAWWAPASNSTLALLVALAAAAYYAARAGQPLFGRVLRAA